MAGTTEDVIDYATKKRESSTQPTETRKKRKVQFEEVADAQDEEQDENDSPPKRDPGDEYDAMVEHSKAQNKKNSIDLMAVDSILNEAPDASETSDDKSDDTTEERSDEVAEERSDEVAERSDEMAQGISNVIQPQLVPSGPAFSATPLGQNLGSNLSQKRKKIPRLSPTLVSDASVFGPSSNMEDENRDAGDAREYANGRERAEGEIEGSTKEEQPSVSDDRVHVSDASTTNEFSVTGDIKPPHVLGDKQPNNPGESKQSTSTNGSSEQIIPASILEKGIISFFYRPRVGLKGDPQSIDDIGRSYFTLRPVLSSEETIPEIPMRDDSSAYLLSLTKNIWPKSGQDKSLCFVDGVDMTVEDLRTRFFGPPQISRAELITDGVYAILSTGRESHLAYHVTNLELSQLQKDLGIKAKGSFVCLVKNPNASNPTVVNTVHVRSASYSDELQKKFGDSQWTPLVPKHLTYECTQMLLIGQGERKNDENNKLEEEMNELEQEDYDPVEALKEDDPIYADLEIDAKVLAEKNAQLESKV